jgi:hypothetical protein
MNGICTQPGVAITPDLDTPFEGETSIGGEGGTG